MEQQKMPPDADSKVFDVARPAHTQPDTTSRPIIVGHHPQVSDPMVNADPLAPNEPQPSVKPIHVAMDEDDDSMPVNDPKPDEESATIINPPPHEPTPFVEHHVEPASYIPQSDVPTEPLSAQSTFEPTATHDDNTSDHEAQPLQMARGAGPRRSWTKVLGAVLVVLILVAVAGYLLIDAGLVKSNIKLPFHIFNLQKTSGNQTASNSSTTPAPTKSAPTPTSVPSGFTAYTISGTSISFDYPTAWGAPVATSDPGYSTRSKSAKSDSTYAYLIYFAANKDVQLAFTSAKALPAARTPRYYDYLQWCVGTNNGLFYKQSMHVTTSGGVDSPANVVCDQGPLADATKIDNQTIVQPKTKDASGALLGDIYTLNLTDPTYSVMRIKDATSANGSNIKILLASVK